MKLERNGMCLMTDPDLQEIQAEILEIHELLQSLAKAIEEIAKSLTMIVVMMAETIKKNAGE